MATYERRQREARDAEILKLLKLGRMTNKQIAYRCGVSTSVVERVKREAGLLTKRGPLTTEQRSRAECLLADGASQAEVARSIGCSPEQLRHAFPKRSWTSEQRVQAEHDLGIRKRTAPVIRRRRPRRGDQ